MQIKWKNALNRMSNHLGLACVVFVILYWLTESAVHSYFFGGGPFLSHLIYPDVHELWMRLIVVAILVIFSFYGQNIINQLRRTELALIEREKEAQRILENNPAAIILIDSESRTISYANHNAINLIGSTLERLQSKICHNYLCDSQEGKCPVLDMGQQIDISERQLMTAEKKRIPILKSVTKVQYQGKPHLLEAFFDITEQKRMEQAIRQAHAELNQIFQTATVGMRLIDRNFNILKVNQTFADLAGVDPEDAIGKKCFDIFAGNMCHHADCPLQRVLDGKGVGSYEVTKIRLDGSLLICDLTVTPFEGEGGVIGIVEAFRDITKMKSIQKELQFERDKLHSILFQQMESVGILNDNYQLEYKNEVLTKNTCTTESCLCYEVFRNMSQACEECFMQKALSSFTVQRFEFDTSSGKSFQHTYTPFTDNNNERKVVVARLDISEKKESLAMAVSSERLAALGEVAAGVAHEINNPINGIINYAQILVNKIEKEDPMNAIASRIIGEGDRIAGIVASLLSFSRRDREKRNLVSIRDLLQESLILTDAQLRKDGIITSVKIDKNLMPVLAIGQEIEQVFLNIINNSRYALNERYPHHEELKRLDIDVTVVSSEDESVVRTCFTDYGMGIPADQLSKVVNPFFSTKPQGKGTGLGLTISRRIIENHDGVINIDSIVDDYTRVTVELPAQITNCSVEKIHAHFLAEV